MFYKDIYTKESRRHREDTRIVPLPPTETKLRVKNHFILEMCKVDEKHFGRYDRTYFDKVGPGSSNRCPPRDVIDGRCAILRLQIQLSIVYSVGSFYLL